jgi:predicted lactoylglutathione lyase
MNVDLINTKSIKERIAMIGYVTIGVKDLEKSKAFYSALLADIGAKFQIEMQRIAFIGKSKTEPMIAVCIPFDENDPQPGNGNMIALATDSKEQAAAMYDKAISLGATCEGAPGQRLEDVFYGAYVRDPDGNKLCFYVFG